MHRLDQQHKLEWYQPEGRRSEFCETKMKKLDFFGFKIVRLTHIIWKVDNLKGALEIGHDI
jgi:hypothetical protein